MARKRTKGKAAAFTMFNVAYEDGTMTSNRRASSELVDQSLGESLGGLARTAMDTLATSAQLTSNSGQPNLFGLSTETGQDHRVNFGHSEL